MVNEIGAIRKQTKTAAPWARLVAASLWVGCPGLNEAAPTSGLVDCLIFGDRHSEAAHALMADRSDAVTGGLGEPARRLLAPATNGWEGGRAAFALRVNPTQANYVTVRLWGSDVNRNLLILFCGGRQIGYRHLGDLDLLDGGSEEPGYNERFVYRTCPLPSALTRGKTQLQFEIRSTGPIWGYGNNFAQYQQRMQQPTRGLYRIYTHTNGYFVPPDDEKQGSAPANAPVRAEPGSEVLDDVKARVSREVIGILERPQPCSQMQIHLLARAYHINWTPAFQNAKAIRQIVRSVDALFAAYTRNPHLAEADPATPNPDWFGLGLAADAVRLVASPIAPELNDLIDDGPGKRIPRRAAWSEMFQASRDWHRQHRRAYSNQSMITDLNIYRANRGIAAIDPAHALPETNALRYLYESIGLLPWLGSESNGAPMKPLGDDYYQLTARGLTRELGFVGYYGEVIDWVTQIYDATREPGRPGDPKIKAQLEKIMRAREPFRYPMLDADGCRAMRSETVVGWRDVHFPGDVTYGQRPTRDASALSGAAVTLDRWSVGCAQQMLADNQFFVGLKTRLKEPGLRTTAGLLAVPDDYETVMAQPASAHRLPMTPGQPDFVFSDEEAGVVAIKHGEEILYVSLYWRARHAVNFLARVHHLLPRYSRIAVVREETKFQPSGLVYRRPDWINFGFGNGGLHYPGDLHSAHAGEELPIAQVPANVKYEPGQENVYAGRGDFYTLHFGDYFIAMNATRDRTFEVKLPASPRPVQELVSGRTNLMAGTRESVPPQSTAVFLCPAP